MKQMKTTAVLLLSALLLVLGALLPMTTGWIQDAAESEDIRYAPISEIQLRLYSGDMTILEKIALVANSEDIYAVPSNMATMTTSEVVDKTAEILAPYMELGMFRDDIDLQTQLDDLTPILYYTTGEDAQSCVCWTVAVREDLWSMYLIIDDETGTLISLDYAVTSKSGGYDWSWNRTDKLEVLISYFYDLYTSGLGEEYITSGLRQTNPTFHWEEETIYCPIQWEDAQLGEVTLILRATPYGFNTTIY